MAWALSEPTTAGTDRLVLLSLANHANEIGQSWPSVATIAREANVSERAVQRSIASLKKAGLVAVLTNAAPDERIPRDRRPNLYRILRKRGDAHGTPTPDGVTDETPRGVTPVTERGDASDTQTVSEPSVKRLPSPKADGAELRHELFDAIAAACGIEKPTSSERGRLNKAVKELEAVNASPAEVHERARRWHRKFPDSVLTPQSLPKNWSALAGPRRMPAVVETFDVCPECKEALNERHTEARCRLLAEAS